MKLYPFDEVVKVAKEIIASGRAQVFQQWNCEHCGVKQTMETPNKFYRTGQCEECKKITVIDKNGCNYMVHLVRPTPEDLKEFLDGRL